MSNVDRYTQQAVGASDRPGFWVHAGDFNQKMSQASEREAYLLGEIEKWTALHNEHYKRAEIMKLECDALQMRLNAADQRIDDFAGGDCEWSQDGESGIWNSACGSTWSFHDEGPEENGMNFCHSCGKHLVVEVDGPELDDDWHMNPCKQGHRDVGASGGVAACNQCDEKIEAATTLEAFERWNETHPAAQP
ncbi:hypothetical protein T3A99_12910 [Pseudomonas sp. N-137]|uniref:hypothetical protein n=1 Tax=Pseudomonas sp. N-137 TaxID=3108452 RepID=UPI002ADEC70E|nr:hypothetical protein [Pseudomonas sp. N-137]MEA1029468.1 hypothetical protein [Pseudomonas sp. N-137]